MGIGLTYGSLALFELEDVEGGVKGLIELSEALALDVADFDDLFEPLFDPDCLFRVGGGVFSLNECFLEPERSIHSCSSFQIC